MENDSISSSESKLPLIVGIVGFALGAAGLVLALKAKGAAEAAQVSAVKATDEAAEVRAVVAAKAEKTDVSAVASQVASLSAEIDTNNKRFEEGIANLVKAVTVKSTAAPVANGKTAVAAGPGTYAVVKGDTLSGIAKKAGISLKALQDLNPGVNPNKMQISQVLKTK